MRTRSTPVINSPDPDQPRYLFPPSLSSLRPSPSLSFSSPLLFKPFGQGQLSLAAALLTIFFVRSNCLSTSTCLLTGPPLSISVTRTCLSRTKPFVFSQPFDKEACFEPHRHFSPTKTSLTFPRPQLDKSHEVLQVLFRLPHCCPTLRRPFRPGVEWPRSPSSKPVSIHPTVLLLISACSSRTIGLAVEDAVVGMVVTMEVIMAVITAETMAAIMPEIMAAITPETTPRLPPTSAVVMEGATLKPPSVGRFLPTSSLPMLTPSFSLGPFRYPEHQW